MRTVICCHRHSGGSSAIVLRRDQSCPYAVAGSDFDDKDPTWQTIMPNSRAGDLWYAHSYEPARWELGAGGSPPNPSVIAEFFGDTILVNGTHRFAVPGG